MEATRSLTSKSRKKRQKEVPFYEVPTSIETGAKIIAEARRSVRAVATERPRTPADHRILFGASGSHSRPPSAFSIGARHFSDERSRPPTAQQRLPPIEKTLVAEESTKKLKRGVKATPPTPIQSYEDLSVLYPAASAPPSTGTYLHQSQDTSSHLSPSSPSKPLTSDPVPSAPSAPLVAGNSSIAPHPHIPYPPVSLDGPIPSETAPKSRGQGSSSSDSLAVTSRVADVQSRRELKSGELELKQSEFSPVHSKRSLSADTVKKLLSVARLENGIGSGSGAVRVVSAGDERRKHFRKPQDQRESVKGSRQGDSVSSISVTSTQDSRKSSASLPFWRTEIVPFLQELESTPYQEVQRLCVCCSSLWACLERRGLLGRTGGEMGTKKRGTVLRTVFKLLDHKEPRLLLKVARIIIAMEVSGKNLLNVCKLLFTLAKEEANDELFKEELITAPLVSVLQSAEPLQEQETLVYGLGTLKLLSSSPCLRMQVASSSIMDLTVSTLKVCSEAFASGKLATGEIAHIRNILIQLTGALRSLSDISALHEKFLLHDIIPHLSSVLSDHITSPDIVFNISRVLSKLTLNSGCLSAVLQCPPLLPLFLQALTTHTHHTDIVLRVCFILGNMTSEDNQTRHALFFQHHPLSTLNPLFKDYLMMEKQQLEVSGSSPGPPGQGVTTANTDNLSTPASPQPQASKSKDVLIKLVRLIANLSVHAEVGPRIAGDQDTVHFLLMILANFPLGAYEELVLNSLATLNNLSYYAQPDSCIVLRLQEVAELMVRVMMFESTALLLESTRVCGNISRYPPVRDILVTNKVDEIMVTLLDSGNREMVYSACGVLINILADSAYHQNIAKNGGIRKLVDVLHDFGQGDWQLASLVCKTLWNYSEKLTSSVSCFGEEETVQLIQLLTRLTDSHELLPPTSTPPKERTWQNEFLPVAQDLLSRIKAAHHSDSDSTPS